MAKNGWLESLKLYQVLISLKYCSIAYCYMSSQRHFTDLLFVSLKGFLATIIVMGVFLGYQGKILGFSVSLVGSCLIGQGTQQIIQNNKKNRIIRAS